MIIVMWSNWVVCYERDVKINKFSQIIKTLDMKNVRWLNRKKVERILCFEPPFDIVWLYIYVCICHYTVNSVETNTYMWRCSYTFKWMLWYLF